MHWFSVVRSLGNSVRNSMNKLKTLLVTLNSLPHCVPLKKQYVFFSSIKIINLLINYLVVISKIIDIYCCIYGEKVHNSGTNAEVRHEGRIAMERLSITSEQEPCRKPGLLARRCCLPASSNDSHHTMAHSVRLHCHAKFFHVVSLRKMKTNKRSNLQGRWVKYKRQT